MLPRVPLVEAIPFLRSRGARRLAAHPVPVSQPAVAADPRGDVCLISGGEGHSLSQPLLAACDGQIRVPMKAGFDSLNVVSASGILIHEAARNSAESPEPTEPLSAT